jgi:hypothetical protein
MPDDEGVRDLRPRDHKESHAQAHVKLEREREREREREKWAWRSSYESLGFLSAGFMRGFANRYDL